MPATKLIFFRESDGTAPGVDWLKQLRKENPRAYAKCRVRLGRLADLGHDLRRPEADYLRDGIYELRSRLGTVNYRVLYFFHGKEATIVSHGFTKEADVPSREIDRAMARKAAFTAAPNKHTYTGDLP